MKMIPEKIVKFINSLTWEEFKRAFKLRLDINATLRYRVLCYAVSIGGCTFTVNKQNGMAFCEY